MGKRNYAMRLYGSFEKIVDLENDSPPCPFGTSPLNRGDENLASHDKGRWLPQADGGVLITNVHAGVKTLLKREIDPLSFFADRIKSLRHCVIIGDEINGGVVPVDKFERMWRSETGKVYQYLASEADIVDRIFAGLPLRLKPSCAVRNPGLVEAGLPSGQSLIL